jgi:hypothetical protein
VGPELAGPQFYEYSGGPIQGFLRARETAFVFAASLLNDLQVFTCIYLPVFVPTYLLCQASRRTRANREQKQVVRLNCQHTFKGSNESISKIES